MNCIDEIQKYKNKEFCKSIQCSALSKKDKCKVDGCLKTAKEFHHWLNENNFCITKCIKYKD
jgi:hypothetical protein